MAEIIKNPQDHDKKPHGHESEVAFERKDVNVFQISAFGIGLLLAVIVSVFAMWAMFDFFYHREDEKNANNPAALMLNERPKLPPEPRLQSEPKLELKDMKADEETILNSYGWLDPNKGTVRIPIDLAIDLVAKKGLPAKPSPTGGSNDGYRMIPEDSSSGRTLEKISQ
ncbi:MAG TPA: hypothetical protein VG273_05160 [Bryobacteraceae bacterium]|jgi:hypothetical protein|nr:hypothetical protein [Bryobacteraceae bacterium]